MNKTQPKELFGIHTQHDVQTLNSSDKKDTRHYTTRAIRSNANRRSHSYSNEHQKQKNCREAINKRKKRNLVREALSIASNYGTYAPSLPEPQGFRPQFRATNPQTEGGGAQSPRISARWQHHPVQHP
jgi:hypothetical protein